MRAVSESFSFFLIALSAIFFVVDPIGIVPVFLAMTAQDAPDKVRSMAFRACVVGGGLLAFFALFGGLVFQMFGVSLGAFRVAGGLLLLLTAADMLRAQTSPTKTSPKETQEAAAKDDVAIVPLAIPLLSGPGSIATVMVLMAKEKNVRGGAAVLASIALTFVVSYFVLRGAALVQRVLKQTGVAILQRVMGLILAAIAVQFVADGARDLLQAHP
jgi:multiple antibiotic resistance protein